MIKLKSTTLKERFFEYVSMCIEGEFIVSEVTMKHLDLIFKTIEDNKYGVCLLGNRGAGKTFIFEVLSRIIHPQDKIFFLKRSCIGIVEDFNIENDRKGGSGDNVLRSSIFKRNIQWDDLMREPMGKYNVDIMPKIIFNADERYKQSGIKSHFTCNFMPESIEKRYDDYIWSRIKGMCVVIGIEPNRDFRDLKNFKEFPNVFHKRILNEDEQKVCRWYEESSRGEKIRQSGSSFEGIGDRMRKMFNNIK